jgi:hypothetical protein
MISSPCLSARQLRDVLRCCWSADTSADPERWSTLNAAWGQCAVSALIVQDHLGGTLLRCRAPCGSHYFNELAGGQLLDMTAQQFGEGFVPYEIEARDRAYVLSFPDTRRRYEALRRGVDAVLAG